VLSSACHRLHRPRAAAPATCLEIPAGAGEALATPATPSCAAEETLATLASPYPAAGEAHATLASPPFAAGEAHATPASRPPAAGEACAGVVVGSNELRHPHHPNAAPAPAAFAGQSGRQQSNGTPPRAEHRGITASPSPPAPEACETLAGKMPGEFSTHWPNTAPIPPTTSAAGTDFQARPFRRPSTRCRAKSCHQSE